MMKPFSIFTLTAITLVSCARNYADENKAASTWVPISKTGPVADSATNGRVLFLKNCAHCHAADARGDEGPDLHNLDWTDEQITTRIRNGKKGEMTAFAGKLSPEQIHDVVIYLRTLK